MHPITRIADSTRRKPQAVGGPAALSPPPPRLGSARPGAASWRRRRWRRVAPAGRGPAIRRRALDGVHRRGLVALADDAAVDRPFLRHVLAAGRPLARARRHRPDRRLSGAGRRLRGRRGRRFGRRSATRPSSRCATPRSTSVCPGPTAAGRSCAPRSRKDGSATARCSRARFTPSTARALSRQRARRAAAGTDAGSASSALLVGGADVEMADPRLNTALLQRIAAATGGRLISRERSSR